MDKRIENLNKLKVGDKAYLFADGCNSRRYYKGKSLESKISEVEIIKVTKKYITTSNNVKFDTINYNEKTNYCEDYYIFSSKQEIYDQEEVKNLLSNITDRLKDYDNDLSLDQLRRIKVIIEE